MERDTGNRASVWARLVAIQAHGVYIGVGFDWAQRAARGRRRGWRGGGEVDTFLARLGIEKRRRGPRGRVTATALGSA